MKTDFNGQNELPAQLADARVVIWGMGLMGGSLALALRGKTAALFGIDPDHQVCEEALNRGIVDRASCDPAELLPMSNLVILSAPLGKIPGLLESLPGLHPGSAVVLDLGSTKSNILESMQGLPNRFAPIGGHPMCGKEVSTLANASSSLYQNASFALLPLARTPASVSDLAARLVYALGAHPVWMEPTAHDVWVASISHLPYLVSNTLAGVTPLEAAPLVGPGFTSTARLAGESIDMMLDILKNNRKNVLTALKKYRLRIEQIEQELEAGDFESLQADFQQGFNQRAAVMESFQKKEEP